MVEVQEGYSKAYTTPYAYSLQHLILSGETKKCAVMLGPDKIPWEV